MNFRDSRVEGKAIFQGVFYIATTLRFAEELFLFAFRLCQYWFEGVVVSFGNLFRARGRAFLVRADPEISILLRTNSPPFSIEEAWA